MLVSRILELFLLDTVYGRHGFVERQTGKPSRKAEQESEVGDGRGLR